MALCIFKCDGVYFKMMIYVAISSSVISINNQYMYGDTLIYIKKIILLIQPGQQPDYFPFKYYFVHNDKNKLFVLIAL